MIMLAMLLTGAANTILQKIQNQTKGAEDEKFTHPYVQCAIMFIGEFSCLGVYGITVLIQKHKAKKQGIE